MSEDLAAQIRAGACQEPNPALRVRGEGDLGLRARGPTQCATTETRAIGAGAIPLREATPGTRAKNLNTHRDTKDRAGNSRMETEDRKPALEGGRHLSMPGRLKLGVGVRADLAVEVDFLVLRGNPFHVRALLERNYCWKRVARTRTRTD